MKSLKIFCRTSKIIDTCVSFSIQENLNIIAQITESITTEAGLYVVEKFSASVTTALENGVTLYLSPQKPRHTSDWKFLDRCESKIIEITNFDISGEYIVLCSLRLFSRKSTIEKLFNDLANPIIHHATKGITISETSYPNYYLDTEAISEEPMFRLSKNGTIVQVRPLARQSKDQQIKLDSKSI